MKSLVEKRPAGTKGKYFLEAWLRSTMGPGWRINLPDIDPRQDRNMFNVLESEA